jgi:hypothetical protein
VRRRFALPLAGTLLILAGAAPLAAQDTSAVRRAAASTPAADSLPTGRGRWALEAGLGFDPATYGSTTVGALRFFGRRSAVGFNAFGSLDSQDDADSEPGFSSTGYSQASVGATAGYRRYAAVRGGLAAFGGAGGVLSYSRSRSGIANTRLGVGGYGELGAAYLVARRLSVNASTQLVYVRTTTRFEGVTFVGDLPVREAEVSVASPGWSARFGGVRLSATLFL